MKKTFTRIGALVVAAAAAATFSFGCAQQKTPMQTIEAALEKNADALEKTAVGDKLARLGNGGSIEIKAELEQILAMALGEALDIDASMKMYLNNGSTEAAMLLDVLMNDASIADLLVYSNGEYLSLASDALLGDTAYGISITDFAENFKTSEFGEGGAFDLGIAADLETLFASVGSTDELKNIESKLIAFEDDFKKDLYAIIENNAETSNVAGEISIGDKSVKTNDVVLVYTGDKLVTLSRELLTFIRDNAKLKEIINDYLNYFSSVYSSDPSIDLEFSADEVMGEFYASIDSLLADLDNPPEDFNSTLVTITANISRSTGELIGATVNVDYDGESAVVKLICGPSINDLDEVSISITVKEDLGDGLYDEYMIGGFAYTVIEDTANSFKAALTMTEYDEITELGELSYNKADGSYVLTVNADGEKVGIVGTYTADKNSAAISVTGIKYDIATIDIGEIAIIFNASDKMPTITKYTEILEMDEAAINAFAEELTASIQQLAALFIS